MAGVVCYYNSLKFHYLYVSTDDEGGKFLQVMSATPDLPSADAFTNPISIPSGAPVQLRVEVDYERLRFGYRINGQKWIWLPEQFDASILSDEATAPGLPNFTGAFIGGGVALDRSGCKDLVLVRGAEVSIKPGA